MKKLISLFLWIIGVELVAFLTATLTQPGIDSWYLSINKSPLTPPGIFFSIVWSVLYVLIAIAGWRLFCNQKNSCFGTLRWAFLLQLLLNFSWTPVFFCFHWVGIGFFLIVTIAVILLYLIIQLIKHDKAVSLLLLPYFLWSLFAAYLNLYIFIYN